MSRLVSVRLLERLRAEGIVPAEEQVTIARTDASPAAKALGMWTWYAYWGEQRTDQVTGSQHTMAECLEAPCLKTHRDAETGETSVIPMRADEETVYSGKKRRG